VTLALPSKSAHGWNMSVALPGKVERVFDLAHELATGIPHHPSHPPYVFSLTKTHGEIVYEDGVSAAAEMITTGGHVGTHIDALAHVARDGRVHGGQHVDGAQSYAGGISIHAVHELPPILAPGHLVDLPTMLGRDATPTDQIGRAELDRWFEARPQPKPGSVVLVRTGWARFWNQPAEYLGTTSGCPGVVLSGAEWLTDHGVLATGSDTIAFERTPSPALRVHVHLLVDSGVPVMEALNLEEIAKEKVWEFFFIAIPLPIRNGTGSPIRPIALTGATCDSPGSAARPQTKARETEVL
jgi:kynurenine formamidase